jgi:hypothetical protein
MGAADVRSRLPSSSIWSKSTRQRAATQPRYCRKDRHAPNVKKDRSAKEPTENRADGEPGRQPLPLTLTRLALKEEGLSQISASVTPKRPQQAFAMYALQLLGLCAVEQQSQIRRQ